MRDRAKMGNKLSIIIPAYNVEPYISMCLDSVLACPSKEIEVICIDDGSTDGSGAIIRAYAQRDARISALRTENRGLSAARNTGLERAKGEYVLYVDSDDCVLTKHLARLLSLMEAHPDADVFMTDYRMFYQTAGEIREKTFFSIGEQSDGAEGMACLPQVLSKRECFWNVWRYVYRRKFLLAQQIRFREGVLSEDVDYTTRVFLAEPRIVFLHCPFYCYRKARGDSITGSISVKRVLDTVGMLESSIRLLAGSDFPWKQLLMEQYQFELVLTMAQLTELPEEQRPAVLKKLQTALPALAAGEDRTAHFAGRVCSILGVQAVSRLLYLIKRLRRRARKRWKTGDEDEWIWTENA